MRGSLFVVVNNIVASLEWLNYHTAYWLIFWSARVAQFLPGFDIYHLAVFFWASGYLYKRRPLKDFFYKILKNYVKYVIIALVSYAFLPFWYYLNVLAPISFHEIVFQFAHIILFQVTRGVFTGPMWFVTWLILAQIVFYFVDKSLQGKGNLFRGVVFIILGIIGIIMSFCDNLSHFYYIDRVFLIQPVLFAGTLCKNYKMKKTQALVFAPISVIIIVLLNKITGFHVELSHSELYGYWLFYPIICVGIVFCVSLSVLIERLRIAKAIEFLGKNSSIIMATHIMGFKILDGLIGKLKGDTTVEVLRGYPTSFSSLPFCIIYTAIGIVFPILLSGIIFLLKKKYQTMITKA